ncbi:hypothetical protein CYMTET_26078 [Cymbomonas tetramitiformis]|uniref:Uncharacterized protein n=1 Tax=Cymbomonas tetramitiformis TaxID=36881 RepID=A0AAE0FSH0_9CHLO|nr:hypothetical protein CYMTET_26078 [Cymbomonas tetramitiformis]
MPSLCCINVANVVFWSSRHNDFERHGGLGNTTENACTADGQAHLGRPVRLNTANYFKLCCFFQVVRARVWLSVVGAQHCLPQAH